MVMILAARVALVVDHRRKRAGFSAPVAPETSTTPVIVRYLRYDWRELQLRDSGYLTGMTPQRHVDTPPLPENIYPETPEAVLESVSKVDFTAFFENKFFVLRS